MKIQRRKKKQARTTGHVMVKTTSGINVYVCISPHDCGEMRDKNGKPVTAREVMESSG